MNKTTIISIISLFALLIFQGYWLYSTYENFKEKQQLIINQLFMTAVDNEVAIRFSENDLFIKKTICLEMLDTLLNIELEKKNIHTSFMITLYDKDHQETNHINHAYDKDNNYILTKMHPIGTQGLLFVQAQITLPPYIIFKEMVYAFIISLLIIGITFYCIGYQLYIIQRTRKQMKKQEKVAYRVIHDLKAPLNAVYSILDYAGTTVVDTDIKNFVAKGKIQIKKLAGIIESMLEQSKNKTNGTLLKKEPIALTDTLQQIEEELHTLYQKKNYQFTIQNLSGINTLTTDAARLERCLRNLIENALKYSDNGVEITAILTKKDNRLEIAIQDTGWGISQKAQKHIGKQFHRIRHTGKPVTDGYGIGLSSVKHIVKELDGKFTFISKEDCGSTFFINLPI